MDAGKIERVAVIGSGLMAVGLVQILAQGGCHVYLVGRSEQSLRKCLGRVREGLAAFVRYGWLDERQVDPVLGRIELTTSLEKAAAESHFALETVVEDLGVKREIFRRLDRHAPAETILATNSSSLSVGDIAEATRHPERVVGSHFFYPAAVVPLVEVGYGRVTSDRVVETTVAFWKRCGKEPVVCRGNLKGYLVNRLQLALAREAISLVQNGVAGPRDVDRAIRLGFGLRLPLTGILEQRDWAGLDTHLAASSSIYPTLEDSREPLPFMVERVARGELGAKIGKGFYDWTGKDVESLRRKRQEQLIQLVRALKEIMPEEEDLLENL
ncbi:MAG: 3-hydroxyacyl-CoA dehydrogenase family protein [Chloroflexota bacterium]